MVHKMKNAELYTYVIRILLISLYSLSPLWAQPDTQVSTDKLYVPNGTATQKVLGGGKAKIEILSKGKAAFLGRLTIAPGVHIPEHRDETEEYLYFLQGGGELYIEGKKLLVTAGDSIYMPAKALVSYKNGSLETVVIQVFAGPSPAKKYDRWEPIPKIK